MAENQSRLDHLRDDLRAALRSLDDSARELRVLPELEDFEEELETIEKQVHGALGLLNRRLSPSLSRGDAKALSGIRHDLINHLYVITEYIQEIGADCESSESRNVLDRMHSMARYVDHLIGSRLREDFLFVAGPEAHSEDPPQETGSRSRSGTAVPHAEALKGSTLLIVDDDEEIRKILRRQLESLETGSRILVAGNGAEAMNLIESEPIDLVLLDIVMPEMDGLEVLERIRERFSLNQLPVVMSTGKTDTADVVRAFHLGASDYVTKPLDLEVVVARVGTQLSLKRASEELEKRNLFIRSTLGRFMTDRVVDKVLEDPAALKPEGEKRTVTVLMSDLRGFTTFSENLPPEKVVEMLNIYLTAMVSVIDQFEGTIDEIIGDATLVLFGTPIRHKDHAERGVGCAIAMQRAMGEVNRRLTDKGLPEISMGIGVNTGEVVVGSIGSVERSKYGVVGKPVNLAARIEACTVGGQILISETTHGRIQSDLEIAGVSTVHAKGFEKPLELYDIVGLKGRFASSLPRKSENWTLLSPTIPLRFAELQGKLSQSAHQEAEMVEVSENEAYLRTENPPPLLSNLRLHLTLHPADKEMGDFYGKVLGFSSADPKLVRLHFTDVPNAVREIFEERRGSSIQS
jgi:class 3 adenylate cyclase